MNVRIVLERILVHCADIASDTEGYSRQDFEADGKTKRAAYMSLHQIGELVGRLPEAFRIRHPDIPWRGIRQMRNIISHEYIRIDPDVVWETLQTSIPVFQKAVMACVESIRNQCEPEEYPKEYT